MSEDGNLTAHGAKLLTKEAIKSENKRKRYLALDGAETTLFKSVLEAVRQAANKASYNTTMVVGQGLNPPQQVLDSVKRVGMKLEGLGYNVKLGLPQPNNPKLTLILNWERDKE